VYFILAVSLKSGVVFTVDKYFPLKFRNAPYTQDPALWIAVGAEIITNHILNIQGESEIFVQAEIDIGFEYLGGFDLVITTVDVAVAGYVLVLVCTRQNAV